MLGISSYYCGVSDSINILDVFFKTMSLQPSPENAIRLIEKEKNETSIYMKCCMPQTKAKENGVGEFEGRKRQQEQ